MNAPTFALALLLFQAPAPASDLAPGVQLFETGRFAEARTFFETFAAGHPKSAAAAFYLGQISLTLKDAEKAV